MKVIIPVAGLGSRLRPHTFTQPKVLLPLAGKPIVGHIVDQVTAWGGDRLVFIIGHFGDQIEHYLRRNYHLPMEFRRQEMALGLGHAVLIGLDDTDRDVLIILGDTLLDADLSPLIQRGETAIGVKEVEDARKFGVVEMEDGRVKRLVEKPPQPPSNLAIVGVYYIRDGACLKAAGEEVIKRGKMVKNEYQLTDALQIMLEWQEHIGIFHIEGWFDCGKPETILETNRFLFDKLGSSNQAEICNDSIIVPPVHIAPGAHIVRSIIGPYAVIGENSIVQNSNVRDSLIGEETHLERAVVADSIIGNRTRINGRVHRLNLGAASEIEV